MGLEDIPAADKPPHPSIFLCVLLPWGENLIIPNVRATGDLRNIEDFGVVAQSAACLRDVAPIISLQK